MSRLAHQPNREPLRADNSYWYVFKLSAAPEHWPRQGSNTVRVTLLERDPGVAKPTPPSDDETASGYNGHVLVLHDVELDLQYLRGRSWHRGERGEDDDLGPSMIVSQPRL